MLDVLKEEKRQIQEQIQSLNLKLQEIEDKLQQNTDYIAEQFDENISKQNTPFIYELLTKIKDFKKDDRDYLEWGRGKNVVDYSGYKFEYDGEIYTAGYAYNWCTSSIFYAKSDDADRRICELEYTDIEKMREIESDNRNNFFQKIDTFLLNLEEQDILYKLGLLIIFNFTDYAC